MKMLPIIAIKYLSFYHLLIFGIAYFILDDIKSKKRINYLLFPLIVLFGIFVGMYFTYVDSVVLYLFFLILSVKNSEERSVVSSLLIVSSACSLEIIVSWLMKPMLSFVIENPSMPLFLGFVLLYHCVLFFGIILYRKWLLPLIRRKKKIDLLAYLLTISLIIYFSYWTIVIYASTPFLKIFVAVFYLVFMVLGGVIIQSISSNQELRMEAEKRQLEYDIHQRYIEDLKNQYQGIREFRHDYVNILASIEYYIEKKEFESLEKFFHSSAKRTKTIFEKDMLHVDELNKLDSLDVKSILTMKLLAAQEQNVLVQIEADEGIKINQGVDSVLLIRILGILLDNAIEEAATIENGKLSIGIFSVKGDTIFVIENSAREKIEPLQDLKQKGYSTKGEGRGLGLSNIAELTAMEPNILLETMISDRRFVQKVVVISEEG